MATALLFGSDTRLYLARPPTGGLTGFNGVQFAAGAASLTNGPEVVAAVNVNSPAPFNKLRRSIFASLCYLELRHVPMLCLDRRVVNRDPNSNGLDSSGLLHSEALGSWQRAAGPCRGWRAQPWGLSS